MDALSYGAPPHGGIALGIDRVVMLFAGYSTTFATASHSPKRKKRTDMMTEAPGDVDEAQLAELGITIVKPETEEV